MAESHFDRRRRERQALVRARWAALRGLPAVLVVVACVSALTLAQARLRQGDVRRRYLEAAQAATEAADWDLVETLGRKLAHLRPSDPIGQYFIALSADGNGQQRRAVRLMRQIAPRDRRGFTPAHWWLVRSMTTRESPLTSSEVGEVRDHLVQFLRVNDDHVEANVLLAQTEFAAGELDAAVRQMEVAGNLNPQLHLTAARFASRLGRSAVARSQTEQASRYYRQQVKDSPDDVAARLTWAETLTMLGETEQAARALSSAPTVSDDPRLLAGYVRLCNSTFDILQVSADATGADGRQQLALLKQSLRIAPQSSSVLKRLAQLAIQDGEAGQEAADLLAPYLTAGTAPATVHLVLGNDSVDRQDYHAAERHFARAHQLNPAFPACLNNLAWSIAQGDSPDLDRALSFADQATRQEPERPEFHETRGQILLMLGRFEEAVPELQFGLYTEGDVSSTHTKLAEAYQALGRPVLATHHRTQGQAEGTSR